MAASLGNGLRGDIWEGFRKRFGIQTILEFYGATEGNVGLLNVNGRVLPTPFFFLYLYGANENSQAGACGQIPYFLRPAIPFRLIKYDVENDVHVRGSDGLCVECPVGEVGEGIGKIDQDPSKISGTLKPLLTVLTIL